jgi:hypothetical protein
VVKTLRSGLIAAALALAVAAPAEAQGSLGVVAGFNISNFTFNPPVRTVYAEAFDFDASSAGLNGLAAGISLERPLGGRPRVRIEGLFSQAGTTIEGSGNVNGVDYSFLQKIKLSMLEVPMMAVFPMGAGDKVRLMGGGFLAARLSQKETVNETLGGESREIELEGDDQAQIKSPHFGVALGAEVNLTPRVGVGSRFNLGLTNLDNEDDFDSIRMRLVRIYVVIKLK